MGNDPAESGGVEVDLGDGRELHQASQRSWRDLASAWGVLLFAQVISQPTTGSGDLSHQLRIALFFVASLASAVLLVKASVDQGHSRSYSSAADNSRSSLTEQVVFLCLSGSLVLYAWAAIRASWKLVSI